MRHCVSAPSLGGLAQQPLGWHQGEVHCEQHHDSATVSRWAGRLRTAGDYCLRTAIKKPKSSVSANVDSQQGLPPPISAPVAPASSATVRQARGKISPPDLRIGPSDRAQAENVRTAKTRFKESSTTTATRRRTSIPAMDYVPDAKRFEKQTDRLSSAISDIKERHQAFQPMTAAERARADLFARRSTIRSNGKDIAQLALENEDEEGQTWSEKIEAWKYVRRIEPELPPLEPIAQPLEREVRDQSIVNFNASPDILVRFSPRTRDDWISQRNVNREAHRCVVSAVREQRKADFIKKRQADAFKVAFPKPQVQEEEAVDELRYPLEAKWFEFLLVTAFAVNLQEQLSLQKMPKEDRVDYLEKHGERLKKSTAKGGFLIQALVLNDALKDPQTHQRMNMLSCMFSRKFQVRHERRNASTICTCMQKWQGFGIFMMHLKKYRGRIVLLQRWWKDVCKPKLQKAIDKFAERWLRMETNMITHDLKIKDSEDAQYAQTHTKDLTVEEYVMLLRPATLPMEERVQPLLINDDVRTTFISNELRARRFFLLPLIKVWEDDVRAWDTEVAEWQDMQACGTRPPAFRWPPKRPSYLPPEFGAKRADGELEVKDMILRCKSNPQSWTQIPQKVNGKYVTTDEKPASDGGSSDDDDSDLEGFEVDINLP